MIRGRRDGTVPWSRWVQLALLASFASFQLLAYAASRGGPGSWLAKVMGPLGRLGYWHFFTVARADQVALRFDGFDGSWRSLAMDEWFPARWESGPRWNALGFGRDVGLPPLSREDRVASEQAFLEAACRRSGLQRTRLVQLSWKKRPGAAPREDGTAEPPPAAAAIRVLAIRKCNE